MSEKTIDEYTSSEAKSRQRIVLFMVLITSFLPPFMGSSVNIALPSIERELKMDALLMSWIATSYLLTTAMVVLPMGRLADIYGRKRIFAIGLIIFTLGLCP